MNLMAGEKLLKPCLLEKEVFYFKMTDFIYLIVIAVTVNLKSAKILMLT